VNGEIGWIAVARTPIRPKHDGLLPVPGDGGFEWDGYLKLSELPQDFNPKSGWLASANHNIIPEGYKHQIGYEFAAPYRFERIKQELTAKEKWKLEDFKALQHDQKSLSGLAITRVLKNLGSFGDPEVEAHKNILAEWDGSLKADSTIGPLYALWLRDFKEELLTPHLTKEERKEFGSLVPLPTIIKAFEIKDENWFGKRGPWIARVEFVLALTKQVVKKLHGLPKVQQSRWGALHTVTFHHPLSTKDPSLAKAFDVGPFERGGDANTVNNTRYNDKFEQIHGASYRHLFDLADWDRALATSAPGQSGQPGSPHYADLAPLWAKGEYFALAFSRKKVDELTSHRLTLKPKP
jgi:penicillin amidase